MTSAAPTASGEARMNDYNVRVAQGSAGWHVQILRPGGGVAFTRSCSTETEARTFASTVEQHIYWLSPAKLEEYYRLKDAET